MQGGVERDQRVMSILSNARRQSAAERERYLRAACGSDTHLYREVVEILQWDERMGNFLLDPVARLTEPARPFEPGDLISDRFEIVREVGQGGMGVVYEALDHKRERDQRIAIKAGKVGFQKFLTPELEGAVKVSHHNVCRVNEIYTAQTKHGAIDFLSMEFLEGETLTARLSEKGRLPQKEARDTALQICAGLSEAHRSGVIHRDLKSANIILCKDRDGSRRVVITDFGLAAAQDVPSEDVGGTPGYMAPELRRGEQASKASDIYALGVVLYEMITGHKPVEATLSEEDELPGVAPPSALIKHLDSRWDDAILPCLEPSPAARPQDASEVSAHLRKSRVSKPVVLSALLMLVTLVVCAITIPQFRERIHAWIWPPRFHSSVVLADFDNKTGDPVFDGTLEQGLALQLEQSPFLNLVSGDKVNETLKLMDRPAGDRLTPEVARQVCERTDSDAMITGSIAELGSHYVIGLKAVDCQTGELLAEAQQQAIDKEAILKALDKAAVTVRRELGESLSSVQKYAMPLEQATTPSLEALEAFTRARRLQMTGEADPIPLFQRAVTLDPKFAAAYSALGIEYTNRGQATLAMQNYEKAYQLRDRVSERERFAIEGNYYDSVTGELERANQSYLEWIQNYPQDGRPHQDLSVNYTYLGQNEKAKDEALKDTLLSPQNGVSFAGLAADYVVLNRPNDVKAVFNDARARRLEHPFLHLSLYNAGFLLGDDALMRQQLAWAMGKPGSEDLLLAAQSDTEAYYGRFNNSRSLSARAVQSAKLAGMQETAALWKATEALREAEIGNARTVRLAVDEALALSPGRDISTIAALALARAGDTKRAEKLANSLGRQFPHDTMLQNYSLPTIRASIELAQKHPSRAMDILTVTSPYELGIQYFGNLYPAYIRGQAYLQAGQPQAAAAEFQKMLDHPGVTLNFVIAALVHLQLGRAQAQMGEIDAARRSYKGFLDLWRGADQDVPILLAARAEYHPLILNSTASSRLPK